MITDETFQVELEYTCAAVKTSQALQEWWLEFENREHLSWFAHILIVRLQTCFCCKHSTNVALKKQKMWRSFQTIRTSDTFVKDWKVIILQSVNLKAFPAFYQFVTDYIFTELIKLEFSIQRGEDDTESSMRPLTEEEQCALRYVATETGSHTQNEEMMFLLMEFAGDALNNSESEKWVEGINRGGLCTISDQAYNVFVMIEDIVRKHFTLSSNMIEGASTCIETILCNNDLLFEWSIIGAEVEEEVSKLILKEMIQLYVTVRGFGFASSCLELYKQAQQKTMSKTRAMRSELCPQPTLYHNVHTWPPHW